VTTPQVEQQLREALHLFGQAERALIVSGIIREELSPFDKSMIDPLPDIFLLFIEHLVDALPSHEDSRCFLIESFDDSLILIGPLSLDSSYSCH
jgi:hypothetical protein